MASTKLIATLSRKLPENINKKIKLCFDENKLDASTLETLKKIFQTSSSLQALEFIWFALALSELEAHKSILGFPAYDYMQKIETLREKASTAKRKIFLPRWVVIATAKIVKNKYNSFEFDRIEEVLELSIKFVVENYKLKSISSRKGLNEKVKITFYESELDFEKLKKVKLIFNTESNKEAVRFALCAGGLSELKKEETFLDEIPEMDRIDKIVSGSKKLQEPSNIYVPAWTVFNALSLAKNGNSRLDFQSLIEAAFTLTLEKTKSFWSY